MVLRKVVPPTENIAFFVTTNVVITPNQTLGYCPEVSWSSRIITIGSNHLIISGRGPQTGRCIPTDNPAKYGNISLCEIQSWCLLEDDYLILGRDKPLISGSKHHTVFIKNSIKFSYWVEQSMVKSVLCTCCCHLISVSSI